MPTRPRGPVPPGVPPEGSTDHWRRLRDRVAASVDTSALREFYLQLNRHLVLGARKDGGTAEAGRAAALCVEMVEANPGESAAALGALLASAALQYHDPLAEAVFEAARRCPPLLGVLADLVETEHELVQCRVRAVEALATARSPAGTDTTTLGPVTHPALRLLNGVLDELAASPENATDAAFARWGAGFGALAGEFDAEHDVPLLAWMADALERLGSAPLASETMAGMLRILRVNPPLPAWHAASEPASPQQWARHRVNALVVDKAIQVVFAGAAARWRGRTGAGPRLPRPVIEPWPFTVQALEARLLDGRQGPRARAMAACLLRLLTRATPTVAVSPRAALYASLLLDAFPGGQGFGGPDWLADEAGSATLDILIDALGDECVVIRRLASETCQQAALKHPASFEPWHYTKLLPLLSDDDAAVRECTMRTFQALASFRSRRLAAVVDDIAARLHGHDEGREEEHARRDLESALGITMDRLVDDVEQLQREVGALEARRRELLRYMEMQAVRVGEEIHLEVLNTLTGYLATAVDERDYPEAMRRLDGLVAELRRIMNNLYPRDLETEGFLQTIRNRLRDTVAQMHRTVPGSTVRLDGSPGITDASIRACLAEPGHLVLLYRIVLEAIVNARKHSKGTSIGVSVRAFDSGRLEIAIEDNGGGRGGPFRENVGMALMRQRAEEIGAAITYQAGPGGGTKVAIHLGRPGVATRHVLGQGLSL